MATSGFTSPEIEVGWAQLEGALDHIVELVRGLDERRLNWRPPVGDRAEEHANSLCVLATHALGTTEEAMLFKLGGEDGIRDRASEFASAGAKSEAIEQRWRELRERIPRVLAALDVAVLEEGFPHRTRGLESGRQVLHTTMAHVAMHAGHADMTRDLLPD